MKHRPGSSQEYDRFRRPLNIEYVQQQTIANKKRLEEKDLSVRAKNNEALRKTAADPAAHRAYLLRASLIESVRTRAAFAQRARTGDPASRSTGTITTTP